MVIAHVAQARHAIHTLCYRQYNYGHKGLYGKIVGGEQLKNMYDFRTKSGLPCFSSCFSVSCDVSESNWVCLSGSQSKQFALPTTKY